MVVSAPLALLAGRWSDRTGRPILPLQVCALISALALCCMAIAPGLLAAKLAYGLFGVFSAIFLALHSAQTLRILPRADRRGRDLGLFNLSNTVPSLVMPWMAMAIIPRAGFPALFLILALLSALGALLLSKVTPDG
jgi:MFS family permease